MARLGSSKTMVNETEDNEVDGGIVQVSYVTY